MQYIDLSHTISTDMPVYPGTEQPLLDVGCTIETDGFLEKKITFYSHTGTHMDAPAHLIEAAKTLDQYPVGHFHGSAMVLDASTIKNSTIGLEHLRPFEKDLQRLSFILIHTGWAKLWGTPDYFENYPTLTCEAAEWLCGFDLKGIGLDTISADTIDATDYPNHMMILKKEIVIIENLTRLDQLIGLTFDFSCFPLNFKAADGSPIRAVAMMDSILENSAE